MKQAMPIGLKLAKAEVVQKVTIIPRGDAGGYVMTPEMIVSYIPKMN